MLLHSFNRSSRDIMLSGPRPMLSDHSHKAQGRHQEGSTRQGPVPGRTRLIMHLCGRKERGNGFCYKPWCKPQQDSSTKNKTTTKPPIHFSISSKGYSDCHTNLQSLEPIKFRDSHRASAKQLCPEFPPALALSSGLGCLPGHNNSQRTGSRRNF